MNTYTRQAQAVTAQRRNAGRYPTRAQIAAGRKLINQGVAALTAAELELLATHPDMSRGQRDEFAALAAK